MVKVMKNKKLIIFNILFIVFWLISVFSVNVFATENVVVNEKQDGIEVKLIYEVTENIGVEQKLVF